MQAPGVICRATFSQRLGPLPVVIKKAFSFAGDCARMRTVGQAGRLGIPWFLEAHSPPMSTKHKSDLMIGLKQDQLLRLWIGQSFIAAFETVRFYS